LYFYHPDHLGSTSIITDRNGIATQFVAYLPFGEQFVDEHTSSWESPYKFNGKELDAETGLYFYGARYYDPKTSLWYGVDMLTEKYPNIGGYVYCHNSPLNRIDVDGNIDFPLKGNYAVNKKDYANGAYGLANAIVRTSLYKEVRNIGTSPHIGIDYRASIGTPVYSLGDGTVSAIGTTSNGIEYITIEYGNGDNVRFLHMESVSENMVVGKKVFEGQEIGTSGNSGQYKAKDGSLQSYAPHLHIDAKDKDGNSINPEQNKYGTTDNKTFFETYGGDYLKLYNAKQEGIKKLNEAGDVQ
jgi:RHS repeat-associated protein